MSHARDCCPYSYERFPARDRTGFGTGHRGVPWGYYLKGSMAKPETALRLLARAREGDRGALESLFARYLPPLRRWASGRLPQWARDVADTQDLVQEVLLQTFKRIGSFECQTEAGLQAYLRQAVLNRIRDEFRHRRRAPRAEPLDSQLPDDDASPLEQAIGREAIDRYERALAVLRPEDREAVVGRLELGLTYQELAAVLDKPTPDAARKAVERALVRLAEGMHGDG